jgi:hypothetical protein
MKAFIPEEYRLKPSKKKLTKRLKLIENDGVFYEEKIKVYLDITSEDSLERGIEKVVLAINKMENLGKEVKRKI